MITSYQSKLSQLYQTRVFNAYLFGKVNGPGWNYPVFYMMLNEWSKGLKEYVPNSAQSSFALNSKTVYF